ncbi:sensor histidine kinase [Nannocystis pusilla]|uniref:GAF domain-containing sensor histidine kinase n=1 Tax=Nannocystis pusilla TaxID=889268 RepID=UPI003DA1F05C
MANTVQADDAASTATPGDAAGPSGNGPDPSPRPEPLTPLLLCSAAFAGSATAAACRPAGELRPVAPRELGTVVATRRASRPCVVLLDEHLLCDDGRVELQPVGPTRIISLLPGSKAEVLQQRFGDALSSILSPEPGAAALLVAIRTALRDAAADDRLLSLEAERRRLAGEITKLNRIGIALSTERDQERLLNFILTTARDFTCSDAGSLYIVEKDASGTKRLRFNNSQNDSLPHLELVKFTIPVSKSTLAGYVAVTGEPVNIPDAYLLDPKAEYSFNPAFDQRTGYRTRSMLVLPMKNQDDQVIGVLQLINRKISRTATLTAADIDNVVLPYDDAALELTLSLASQTAISLTNNQLYEGLRESLVELKQTQAQLVQGEKLASLGQLTAGVAHEINNPLAFSRNNTHLAHERVTKVARRLAVQRWLEAGVGGDPQPRVAAARAILDKLKEDKDIGPDAKDVIADLGSMPAPKQLELLKMFFSYVSQSREQKEGSIEEVLARTQKVLEECFIGLDRMAEIVLGLRNFARLDEAQFQNADIDEGIRQTLMILSNNARDKGVKLTSDLTLTRPYACFPAKLNQVVLNLVNNAIDATPRGGEVHVNTRVNGAWVEIAVRDNGEGISDANISKIFDPFFTTKPVGKGTGLGLSISYRIVMEHQGTIAVTRNETAGVTFLIRIPTEPKDPGTRTEGAAKAAESP